MLHRGYVPMSRQVNSVVLYSLTQEYGFHPMATLLRPDQFNLLLLGFCEAKIGASDRKKKEKKAINWVWL